MTHLKPGKSHDEDLIARVLRATQQPGTDREKCLESSGVPLRTYHRWVKRFGRFDGDTIRRIVALENERAAMERRMQQLEREMETVRMALGKPWLRRAPGGPPSDGP
jgi:septal ring factor EnvC (AmiA/AmiB activator)